MSATYAAPVEQAMQFTFASLNERQRRLFACGLRKTCVAA